MPYLEKPPREKTDALAPRSLFHGVDSAAARTLGIASIETKSSALSLLANPPDSSTVSNLVTALFEIIAGNWNRKIATRTSKSPLSRQNWRWRAPQLAMSECNESPEVTFERRAIRAIEDSKQQDWSNQVPVASGLIGGRGALDFVHKLRETEFEFIELKIGSNTPLYAAIEILKYGYVWLLSRKHRTYLGYDSELLEAKKIDLIVLAPRPYFLGSDWAWLVHPMNVGMRELATRYDNIEMGLRFEAFRSDFTRPANHSSSELVEYLETRQSLSSPKCD